eukprot:757402-Amphidinium_carterae.1
MLVNFLLKHMNEHHGKSSWKALHHTSSRSEPRHLRLRVQVREIELEEIRATMARQANAAVVFAATEQEWGCQCLVDTRTRSCKKMIP